MKVGLYLNDFFTFAIEPSTITESKKKINDCFIKIVHHRKGNLVETLRHARTLSTSAMKIPSIDHKELVLALNILRTSLVIHYKTKTSATVKRSRTPS